MASEIKVDTINTAGGTPFISAQQFRLAGEQAGSGSVGTVLTNWEEVDTDYQALGSAWSQSSGVFSCSVTGIYLCTWTLVAHDTTGSDRFDPSIEISTNSGGAYTTRSLIWGNTDQDNDGPRDLTLTQTFMLDVSNASTFRLQYKQSTSNDIGTGTTIVGNTGYTATQIMFIRLGAT
jgi:hypothetical protein